MGFIGKLFQTVMKKYVEKHGDEIITAINKVNDGGTYDDIDTLVNDYFYILQKVYKKGKPNSVEIDEEDYFSLLVDGDAYDFNMLIRHNDSKNTERKMEIEVLFDKAFLPEIHRRLKTKIESEW